MMNVKPGARHLAGACAIAVLAAVFGCSPVSVATDALKVVGKAVDDEETSKLGASLVGQPASAADAKLGPPQDILRDMNDLRTWRVYPTPMDPLGNQRYVIKVVGGQIAAVSKEAIDASGEELAKKFLYDEKAKGKTPSEVEGALGMGPPVATVRSEMTGQMIQFYNAPSLTGLGSPKLCRVKYDASGRCNKVDMVEIGATAGGPSAL